MWQNTNNSQLFLFHVDIVCCVAIGYCICRVLMSLWFYCNQNINHSRVFKYVTKLEISLKYHWKNIWYFFLKHTNFDQVLWTISSYHTTVCFKYTLIIHVNSEPGPCLKSRDILSVSRVNGHHKVLFRYYSHLFWGPFFMHKLKKTTWCYNVLNRLHILYIHISPHSRGIFITHKKNWENGR